MSIPAMDWEPNSGNVLSHRTPGAAADGDPAWPGDQAAPPLFLERFKRELRLGGVTWQQFCALSFDSIAEFDAAVRSTVRDATDIQIRMMRAEFVGSGGDLAQTIRSGQRFPSPPAPSAWTPSSTAAHEQTPLLSTKAVGPPMPPIAAPYVAAPYIAAPSIAAPYVPIAAPYVPASFITAPAFARGAWVVSTLFVIVAWQIRPYSWLWEQHDTAAWPHLIAMELVSALPVLLLMPVGAGLPRGVRAGRPANAAFRETRRYRRSRGARRGGAPGERSPTAWRSLGARSDVCCSPGFSVDWFVMLLLLPLTRERTNASRQKRTVF
eukprot:TRINITY_DN3098_c0_g1_i4.p1 TRINITY_DN3098_c0_g1~~TRINITY_DN3098_c0_g1_i4.p1  ORF type:complete len:323 (+),score=33.93 TRINITY_DN3098_c0_g1_i4:125-1093(+)